MKDSNYVENKIIRYVYLQPETSVSIEKILNKFKWLTREELNDVLSKMVQNNFIRTEPSSNFSYTTRTIGDSVSGETSKKNENISPLSLVNPTHVVLTLDGKIKAEEHKALVLKSTRIMVTQPIVNTVVSLIIGFLLGYFFNK